MRRFSRRQDVWFHVHLPFVQAVSAPQGEVDEIGLAGQHARAERGAGAKATRGTTERFRRVGWVGAIRSIVNAPSSTARTRPRGGEARASTAALTITGQVSKATWQVSKDTADVDFDPFLPMGPRPPPRPLRDVRRRITP